MRRKSISPLAVVVIAALSASRPPHADAAGYIFAGEANGPNLILHVRNYLGTGGNVVITMGINPASPNAAQMVVPTQNVIRTWNALAPATENVRYGLIPGNFFDYESVLLHEVGHVLGLSHCNLGGAVAFSVEAHTHSFNGSDNVFTLSDGADNVIGTSDDIRGDDGNLNWFRKIDNNPGNSLPAIVDQTTYSRVLADLPAGHTFAANGNFWTMDFLGFPDTSSTMYSTSWPGETVRSPISEDVATLRMAMAGLDRTQGTADDYTFTLQYAGLTSNADIVIAYTGPGSALAFAVTGGRFLTAGPPPHLRVIGSPTAESPNPISFMTNYNWFFNQVSNEADPDNVYVNFGSGPGFGTEASPFNSLAAAVNFANDHATIHLEPGSSDETFTGTSSISKPLTLTNNSPGTGSVLIGG